MTLKFFQHDSAQMDCRDLLVTHNLFEGFTTTPAPATRKRAPRPRLRSNGL